MAAEIGIRIGLQGAEAVNNGLRSIDGGLAGIGSRVQSVSRVLGTFAPALASAFSIGGLVSFVRSTNDAIDAMNDLADATGASIEEISKLDQVARRNGGSLAEVSGVLVKFNAALKEADGKNGISIALKAIGLDAEQLRQADPAAALQDLARALAGYADDGNKARVVQEIFGKSVREAAPLLKDLAEAGALNASVFTQQAAEAEKLNKQLSGLSANLTDAARAIAGGLAPTLIEILSGFDKGDAGVKKFGATIDLLKVPIEAISILGANLAFVFQAVGREAGAIAAQTAALARGDIRGFTAISEAVKDDGVRARAELDAFEKRVLGAATAAQAAVAATATKSAADIVSSIEAERLAAEKAIATKKARALVEKAAAAERSLLAERALKELSAYEAAEAAIDEQLRRTAQAEKELAAARSLKTIASYEATEQAIDAALGSAQEMVRSIERETELMKLSNTEREVSIALLALERAGLEKGSFAYEEYAAKIREAIVSRENVRESIDQTRRIGDEWKKLTDDIERSLTDSLMRGFEAGKGFFQSLWDGIKNAFKTTVLKMIIQPLIGSAIGGFSGLANASGLAGGASQLGTLASIANGIKTGFQILTQGLQGSIAGVTSTLGSFVTQAGNFFGSASLSQFGAGMQGAYLAPGLAGPTTAGAGGAIGAGSQVAGLMSTVGNAAAGYAINRLISGGYSINKTVDIIGQIASLFGPLYGAIGGLANRLFGRKLKEAGIQGTLSAEGFEGNQFEFYKGGLFRSNKTKIKPLDAEIDKLFDDTIRAVVGQTKEYASALGLPVDAINQATLAIKINLKGKNQAQIDAAFKKVFEDFANQLAQSVSGTQLKDLALENETYAQTLERVAVQLTSVNAIFDTLGQPLLAASVAGAAAAQDLLELAGGLEALGAQLGSYYANFYSDAERQAQAARNLSESLTGFSVAIPDTVAGLQSLGRDGFRALVEAQDLTTESGRRTYLALVQASGAFADLVPATEAVVKTEKELAAERNRIAQERSGLERQLLELQGDTAAIRALERAALDETNRALYDQVNALKDSQAAAQAATQAEASLAAERERIASERGGLQRQLLELQGDTAAIRELERNALDESNRALYDQITALQDSQAAAEATARANAEAAQAAAEAARRQQELADAIAAAGRKVADEIKRLRGAATGGATDEANLRAQFAVATAQARAGSLDALNSLPELTAAIEASALLSASSTVELNRIRALLAGSLSDTLSARGIDLPQLATGTDYVPTDLVAQLHEGEAVVPRAYNPAAGAGQGAMVTELRALRTEVEGLRAEARATAVSSNKTARILERVTLDGEAMQTVAA